MTMSASENTWLQGHPSPSSCSVDIAHCLLHIMRVPLECPLAIVGIHKGPLGTPPASPPPLLHL